MRISILAFVLLSLAFMAAPFGAYFFGGWDMIVRTLVIHRYMMLCITTAGVIILVIRR